MHKIIVFLSLSLIPLSAIPAFAEDNNQIFCTSLGEVAGRAMGARLSGVPIADLLKAKFDPAIHDLSQGIIKEAYARPLPGTQKEQIQVMSDFRNDVEAHCHQNLGK